MNRNVRSWIRVASLAAVSLAAYAAATAQADVIAKWTFDGDATTFLVDSKNGNNLVNAGNVAQSDTTATGTGKSAYFNGTSTGYLSTINALNLSSYRGLRITWSQLVTSDNEGLVFEHSENANNYNGAFYFDTNAPILGVPGPGTGAVTMRNLGNDTYNGVGFSHLHGATNTTWENMRLDINLDAASTTAIITVYDGNSPISSYTTWPFGTNNTGSASSAFGDYVLNIGARSGGIAAFTGYIDNFTISTIPEPNTMIILATSLTGLLAYAWRKRK